jgi:hypothetical protein
MREEFVRGMCLSGRQKCIEEKRVVEGTMKLNKGRCDVDAGKRELDWSMR